MSTKCVAPRNTVAVRGPPSRTVHSVNCRRGRPYGNQRPQIPLPFRHVADLPATVSVSGDEMDGDEPVKLVHGPRIVDRPSLPANELEKLRFLGIRCIDRGLRNKVIWGQGVQGMVHSVPSLPSERKGTVTPRPTAKCETHINQWGNNCACGADGAVSVGMDRPNDCYWGRCPLV